MNYNDNSKKRFQLLFVIVIKQDFRILMTNDQNIFSELSRKMTQSL